MRSLRDLDHVAYVRFASVYREFKDIESFMQELESLRDPYENNSRGQEGGVSNVDDNQKT